MNTDIQPIEYGYNPMVSVIIPLHNAAAYISECVESVLCQSYSPIEIIIVENGSEDNSLEIAQTFISDHVNVIVLEIANVSAARNRGLERAKGDYILFLDADDKIDKEKIRKQIFSLSEYKFHPLVISVSSMFPFDNSRSYFSEDMKDYYEPAIDFMTDAILTGSPLNCMNFLIHKALLDNSQPWNEELVRCEDWLWLANVLSNAKSVVYTQDAVSYYRTSNIHSLSKQYDEHAVQSEFFSRTEIAKILAKTNAPKRFEAAKFLITSWNRILYPFYRAERKQAEEVLKELVPNSEISYPKITWKEKINYLCVLLHLKKSNMKP